MATIQVTGTVRNGVVELPEPLAVPDGTAVVVTVPEAATDAPPRRASPTRDHPAIGMWADREDMADSAAWVANLRKSRRNRLTRPD